MSLGPWSSSIATALATLVLGACGGAELVQGEKFHQTQVKACVQQSGLGQTECGCVVDKAVAEHPSDDRYTAFRDDVNAKDPAAVRVFQGYFRECT